MWWPGYALPRPPSWLLGVGLGKGKEGRMDTPNFDRWLHTCLLFPFPSASSSSVAGLPSPTVINRLIRCIVIVNFKKAIKAVTLSF